MDMQTAPATDFEHAAPLQLHVQDMLPAPRPHGSFAVQLLEGISLAGILITVSYIYSVMASTILS